MDDGTLLQSHCEEHATAVQCKHADWRLMRTDDLRDSERLGQGEQHVM
jgi:hypothetical protein